MVEYWACVGLACIDKEFLDKLKNNGRSTTIEYGFRLSKFELAELERLVADREIEEWMRAIQTSPRGGCKPPYCSPSPARSEGYEEYKKFHARLLERIRETV